MGKGQSERGSSVEFQKLQDVLDPIGPEADRFVNRCLFVTFCTM
jgi:hypothetical protein